MYSPQSQRKSGGIILAEQISENWRWLVYHSFVCCIMCKSLKLGESSVILILLGVLLIVGGVFGKSFHVGLFRRLPVSAIQGRAYLIISGILLVGTGVSEMNSGFGKHVWKAASNIFDVVYEVFTGLILSLVGFGLVFWGKETLETKVRWLGAAMAVAGVLLATDGVRRLGWL